MLDKEKRIWLEVLALLREMPHVWDKSHACYKNFPKRRKSYDILLKKYREFDKNCSLVLLKQKIENMRARYFREHKKVTDSLSEGQPTYTSPLWYYSALSFLGANDKPATSKDRVYETYVISPSDCQNPTRELLTPIEERRESFKREPDEVVGPPAKKIALSEECANTAQATGLQLKDLDNHQLVIAQKLISDAIFYAKIGRLCEDSFLCLN